MPGSAHDGGEHSPGGVVSGETSFAHSRSIVYDKSGYFVVTHVARLLFVVAKETEMV